MNVRYAQRARAGAMIALLAAVPAFGRPNPPAWPNQHMNNRAQYGGLDQKDVPGANGTLGRWACGPTSLVNSMAYLQTRFAGHYKANGIDPENYPIPDRPDSMGNPRNMMIDQFEMIKTVEDLAAPLYMNLTKGRPPIQNPNDPPIDPYEYRRAESAGDYGDDWPGPGAPIGGIAGGVTWQRFAFGKNCWLTRPGMAPTVMGGQLRIPWVPPVDPENPPDPPDPGNLNDPRNFAQPGWLGAGAALNMNSMFDALFRGADVEIGFTWSTGFGGHFVTVYGYNFDNDANGNKVFDNGDSAVLKAIDPWGLGAGAVDVDITITRDNLNGDINLGYAGGAAGLGSTGTMKIWTSEIPTPGGLSMLLIGGVIAARRRRRA